MWCPTVTPTTRETMMLRVSFIHFVDQGRRRRDRRDGLNDEVRWGSAIDGRSGVNQA